MLKRLRREFIAITMLLVGLVLAGVLGITLVANAASLRAGADRILDRAVERGVSVGQLGDPTGTMGSDYMLAAVVDISRAGSVLVVDETPFDVPLDTLKAVLHDASTSEASSGRCDGYPVMWKRAETSWGYRIAFLDTYTIDSTLRSQAVTCVAVFLVSMGVLFAVAYVLSGWALRPVERAWAQQRRFVSDASHELKTPLAVIIANTQILQHEKGLPEGSRRWVDSTADEASHLRELIEDLLTLARSDEREASGGKREEAEEVELAPIVSGCCLEFDAVAFERGCSIEQSLAEGVRARVAPEEYGRVVRTLLDNATKYATAGSTIGVRLERDGRRSRLAVNNHGEVIAPEDLEHLFDRFFRTDRARERTAAGGFGLGLAIARGIVEAAGGTIAATSTEADGTTITVTL